MGRPRLQAADALALIKQSRGRGGDGAASPSAAADEESGATGPGTRGVLDGYYGVPKGYSSGTHGPLEGCAASSLGGASGRAAVACGVYAVALYISVRSAPLPSAAEAGRWVLTGHPDVLTEYPGTPVLGAPSGCADERCSLDELHALLRSIPLVRNALQAGPIRAAPLRAAPLRAVAPPRHGPFAPRRSGTRGRRQVESTWFLGRAAAAQDASASCSIDAVSTP